MNLKRNRILAPFLFSRTSNNEESTEPQHIGLANALVRHFQSVFGNPVFYPSSYTVANSPDQKIPLENITPTDVETALKRMRSKRAVRPDGVPQYIRRVQSNFRF